MNPYYELLLMPPCPREFLSEYLILRMVFISYLNKPDILSKKPFLFMKIITRRLSLIILFQVSGDLFLIKLYDYNKSYKIYLPVFQMSGEIKKKQLMLKKTLMLPSI